MKNCCIDHKCILCCLETNMLLSNEDVKRIGRLGFDTEIFVIERAGWLQLKNYNKRCVFHNGVRCSIYKNRPEGCKLYPIIYDKDKDCAIFDDDCPHRNKFEMSKDTIQHLYDLVSKLECERTQRIRKTEL